MPHLHLVVFTPEGFAVDATDAFLDRLGYKRRRFLQVEPKDWLGADDLAFMQESIGHAVAGEVAESRLVTCRTRDAEPLQWMLDTTLDRSTGNVLAYLSEPPRELPAINESGLPTLVFNPRSLEILDANPEALALYGYSLSELRSLRMPQLSPARDRKRFASALRSTELPVEETWRQHTRGDKELWVKLVLRPTGRLTSVTILDQTDRVAGERRYANVSHAFESILKKVPIAIIALDAQGKVLTWSPAAESAFGLTEQEALGRELRRLIRYRSGALSAIQSSVMAGQDVETRLVRTRRKDGEAIELDVAAWSLLGPTEKIVGAIAVIEDVTVRNNDRRTLQQLNVSLERRVAERTAELLAANQELESFCFAVAHDLRQPLRAIDGFSKAVLEDYGPVLGEEGKGHLARVRAANSHLNELIDALLALSRVTRANLSREWVDLTKIARQIDADLRGHNPGREVFFEVDPVIRAYGDPHLLTILLQNLLQNAWKFTANRKKACIEFETEWVDGSLVFAVRDNGAGFDMKYANKLFLPFERLHRSSEFSGHGIGLATCQRIVTRHGGHISLVGSVDRGATAFFTLQPGP